MPYQLHCDALQALLDELETELFELDEGVLLGVELELTTELFELEEVVAVELEVTVVHTAPVTAGFSARLPFLSPCTPKLTDWPG